MGHMRRQILADARLMGEQNYPISPAWWRQLGEEQKAVDAEAGRLNPKRSRKGQRATGSTPARYQIECILEEAKTAGKAKVWYLVRWEGYNPSWEAWRIRGDVGSPLETWEPRSHLLGTEAWDNWLAAKKAAAEAAVAEEGGEEGQQL
eukprot:2407962-Pleurochrysis_carterae.AAC.1